MLGTTIRTLAQRQHKYQLVYAAGAPEKLHALSLRQAALSACLRAISTEGSEARCIVESDPRIATAATWPRHAGPVAAADEPVGEFFRELRLLPGRALDSRLPELRQAIARHVIRNPPHELRWLPDRARAHGEDVVVRFVTDSSADTADTSVFPADLCRREEHRDGLLVLRGLLACGILVPHALSLRHRVDYGADARPARAAARRRLAVPFRACDAPSNRSEFAQPDVAVALTTLSYYHRGLSDSQVAEAFRRLDAAGPSKAERYDAWFREARRAAPGLLAAAEWAEIDCARKLDPENEAQLRRLCGVFRRSCGCIDFWLLECVLPAETVRCLGSVACLR